MKSFKIVSLLCALSLIEVTCTYSKSKDSARDATPWEETSAATEPPSPATETNPPPEGETLTLPTDKTQIESATEPDTTTKELTELIKDLQDKVDNPPPDTDVEALQDQIDQLEDLIAKLREGGGTTGGATTDKDTAEDTTSESAPPQDSDVPSVDSVYPLDNNETVDSNGKKIVVSFSQPMDPSTITKDSLTFTTDDSASKWNPGRLLNVASLFEGVSYALDRGPPVHTLPTVSSVTHNTPNTAFIFTLDRGFGSAKRYIMTLSKKGIMGKSGQEMASDKTWSFKTRKERELTGEETTGPSPRGIVPELTRPTGATGGSIAPEEGVSGGRGATPPVRVANVPGLTGTIRGAAAGGIAPGAVGSVDGGTPSLPGVAVPGPGVAVPGLTGTIGGAAGGVTGLAAGGSGGGGATLLGGADTTPPSVVSVTPTNGQTIPPSRNPIQITFSEPIDPISFGLLSSFTVTSVYYNDESGDDPLQQPVSGSITFSDDFRTLQFTPDSAFTAQRQFVITLESAIQDVAGNALVPYAGHFWTGLPILNLPNVRIR